MKKTLFLGLAMMTLPAFALLSPLNQSLREIEAILASPEIQERFSQNETIVSIEREDDRFILRSTHTVVAVDVVYLTQTQGRVGPKEFRLDFAQGN